MPNPRSLKGLQATVSKKLSPRPYSGNPALDRAVGRVQNMYPADMENTSVEEMSFLDENPGAGVSGETLLQSGAPQTIRMNPLTTLTFPESDTEGTLAHELEHVRQNRQAPSWGSLVDQREKAGQAGYWDNPREQDARKARTEYQKLKGNPEKQGIQPWSGAESAMQGLRKYLLP